MGAMVQGGGGADRRGNAGSISPGSATIVDSWRIREVIVPDLATGRTVSARLHG
jgi:hypothetical protein